MRGSGAIQLAPYPSFDLGQSRQSEPVDNAEILDRLIHDQAYLILDSFGGSMDLSVNGRGPLLGNPLRCLNCYSNSSIREIQQEYRELMRVRLAAVDQEYQPSRDPFRAVDTLLLNRQMVQDAWEIVSNPMRLFCARLLYLNNITKNDADAIQRLRDNDVVGALAIWKRSKDEHASRNRALSNYAAVMTEHPIEPISLSGMEWLWRDFEVLVIPVGSMTALLSLENAWPEGLDLEAVRRICWQEITKDCVRRATSWIDLRKIEVARDVQLGLEHVLTMNDMAALLNNVVSDHLDRYTSQPLKITSECIDDFALRLPNINTPSSYRTETTNWLSRLDSSLQNIRDTIDVFQDRFVVLNLATEPIIQKLRSLSIDINNERSDFTTALTLIGHAKQLAMSTEMIERLRADERVIERNQASSKSTPLAPVRGTASTSVSGSLQTGPFKWGKLLWIVGIVLVLASIGLLNNSDRLPDSATPEKSSRNSAYRSNAGAGTYTPVTRQRQGTETSQYSERMKSTIDSGKIELLNFEARLARMDRKLGDLESTLADQKERLERLESLYNSTGDDTYVSQYEALRLDHNSKVEEYNAQMLTRQMVYRNYETLLESTNRLVDQYNSIVK